MQSIDPNDQSIPTLNGDGVAQARSRVSEMGERAAAAIDDKKDAVAHGMESVASALHDRADRMTGGAAVANAAHTTAEAMENAADYLRDQDIQGMLSDVRQLVKRNPGATLLAAAAVGFLIARKITRH